MRVAVTGSAGFIGDATVAMLHEQGHTVTEIDRKSGDDVLTADLTSLLDDCGAVIHLGGILGTSELFDNIEQAVDINIHGTRRVLEACQKTGSQYVGISVPDCWPSIYQATKLATTRMAHAFASQGLKVAHVRAFNVYGNNQAHGIGHPQKIIPTFASCSWQKRPMPVWGNGQQTVDLVHVDHVAKCLIHAALHNEGGDAGSGRELTVLEVARYVGIVTGHAVIEFLPMRPGELPNTRLHATEPGPCGFDQFDAARFTAAVMSYQ